MATTVDGKAANLPADGQPLNYLNCERGIMSWVFTLDHKRIGVMYLISIMASLGLGGLLAMLIRAELAAPGQTIVNEDAYNQLFTLHGAVMVFLFILPGIPAAIGNFVLPIMLGAKDVAFPRLNLASYYFWVIGALFFLLALTTGGLDTGWTLYVPYAFQTDTRVLAAGLGAFVLGFSGILYRWIGGQ